MSMARKYFVRNALCVTVCVVVAMYAAKSSAQTASATLNIAPASACAINLSWASASGYAPVKDYTATRTEMGGFVQNTNFTIPMAASTYIDTGLHSQGSYAYSMSELQSGGKLTTSTPSFVTLPSMNLAPSVGTVSASVSGGNIVLSMNANGPVSAYGGYTLTRKSGYFGTSTTLYDGVASPVSGNTFAYADATYAPSQSNTYDVRFFDSDYGCGPTMRTVSGFAGSVVVPSAPSSFNLNLVSGATNVVNLSWTPGMAATYAEVWRMEGSGPWQLAAPVIAGAYADSNVSAGSTYSYKIKSCANTSGNVGCGAFTAPLNVAIPASTPEVLGIKARVVYIGASTADVNLTWTNKHANFPYSIQQSTSPTSSVFTSVESVPGTVNANAGAIVKSIPAGGISTFRVMTEGLPLGSETVDVDLRYKLLMKGTAWSRGTGWISLSCETPGTDCSKNRYNVVVGMDNELRGTAWTSMGTHGFGWLSFNREDLTGCPTGACVAKLDPATNKIVGWAKFLGGGSGSWDGWVSLNSVPAVAVGDAGQQLAAVPQSGVLSQVSALFEKVMQTFQASAQSSPAYGLAYDNTTGNVSGTAWGGPVVGWIQFYGSSGAPIVSNVTISQGAMINPARTGGTFCDDDPYYAINWSYANTGGAAQKQVKITVYNASSGVPYATTTSTGYTRYNLFDPINIVGKNKSFTVGISAFDGASWSTEVMSSATTSPSRYYPLVDFTWSPTPAKTAWPIKFDGTGTIDRSGGTNPSSGWAWQWIFPHATTSTDPTNPTATAIFDPETASSTDAVSLTVTDGGHACVLKQQVLGSTGAQPKKIRDIKER